MTHEEFQKRYTYNPSTDQLGEGGFGEVFKAYDTYRDRWVAVKMSKVIPEYETVRLKKEVEMVNNLPVHPNIAYYEECYTFRSFSGEYDFGILQFYELGNLLQLTQRFSLSPEQKDSILRQLLEGIGFLHDQAIIHRDLKPQNILIVNRNGEFIPKITDFGISKKLDINKSSIFSNSLAGAGTLSYASPEQLADRTIRKNTDLWSFGVIAFWFLSGEHPFNTGDYATTSEAGRTELFRQINSGKLPDSLKSITQPWRNLIEYCLEKDPEKRARNVQECQDILEGKGNTKEEQEYSKSGYNDTFVKPSNSSKNEETEFIPTKPTPQPPPKPQPQNQPQTQPHPEPNRRNSLTPWLIGAAIVVLGIVAVAFWHKGTSTEQPTTNTTTSHSSGINIPMVYVSGGTFTMGSNDGDSDEKPPFSVKVYSFYMGKTEVTQAQWKAVMGNNPSYFKGDNLPVESVSWDDVQDFINKLNQITGKRYRLPTEAEWEYASGGGEVNRTKWAGTNNESSLANYAWYDSNSNSQTHPVGTKQPNSLGLYDMSGNVCEWCSNWFMGYPGSNGVSDYTGSNRVNRGGGWSAYVRFCRSASRNRSHPDSRTYFIGFRLVFPE